MDSIYSNIFTAPILGQPQRLGTYTPPPVEVKDTMSDFEALGYLVNTGYNMFRKNLFEQRQRTEPTTQITDDQFHSLLAKETDPYVQSGLINLAGEIDSLAKYQARKEYLQTLKSAEEQVGRNFSTGGMILAGIPLTLLDVDTIPLALLTEGVGAGMKALSLTSKLSKIASGALMGGGIGVENMYLYQSVTGVKKEDAITDSFIVGTLLGGTLGSIVEFSKRPSQLTVDGNGEIIPTARELKKQALDEAQSNKDRIDRAIHIKEEIEKTLDKHQKELNAALDKGRGKVEPVLKKVNDFLDNNVQTSFKSLENMTNEIKNLEAKLQTTTDEIKALTQANKNMDREVVKVVENTDFIKQSQSKIAELIQEKEALVNKAKGLTPISSVQNPALKNQLKNTTSIINKNIAEIDNKIVSLTDKIRKAQGKITETSSKAKTSIGFINTLKSELKNLTDKVKPLAKRAALVEKAKNSLTQVQSKLEKAMAAKQKLLDETKNINLISMGRSETLIKQTIKNNETRAKQIAELDKEIASLNKQASRDSKIQKLSPEETATMATLQQQIAETTNKLNKETSTLQKNTDIYSKEAFDNKNKLGNSLKQKQEEHNSIVETIKNLKKDKIVLESEHNRHKAIFKSFSDNWQKTKIPESDLTKFFRDKIAKAKDYTSILQKRNLLLEEEAKMLNNDFSLFGLKEKYANTVDKLAAELKDMGTVIEKNELMRLPIFKEIPSFIQKLAFSPIEFLKKSENRYVAAFASLLHNGTLSVGKAITYTADNIRKKLDAEWNAEVRFKINALYNQDKAEKLFTGSFEEYSQAVSRERTLVNGRMQKKAHEGIPGGLSGRERMKLYSENLNKLSREYTDASRTTFNKAVDAELNYYEKMYKRGNSLDMIGFRHTLARAFAPRFYSATYIERVGINAAIEELYTAQLKYATVMNDVVSDAEKIIFREKATTAIQETMKGEAILKSVTDPFDTLVKGHEVGLDSLETGRLKHRKIEVFDDDIIDLLDHDSIGTSSAYALSMHGRIALKERVGIETAYELEKLMTHLNADVKDKDNIRVVIDTILGRRELTQHPYAPLSRVVKGLSSISSMLHIGAFGVNTITEITALTKEFGFGRTMAYFDEGLENIYKIYVKREAPDLNQGKLLISYGESLFHHRASRLEAEGMLDSAGKLQQFMDKSLNKLSLLSGMPQITDMLRTMSMALTTDFLARASVRELSPTDLQRVLDMGFDVNDLKEVRKVLQVDKDGNIGNIDRNTWGALDDKLTYAGLTTADRTVLHPSAATLPKFMTDYGAGGIVPRLLLKFLRFPVDSYERLLLRGMQQMDAKQVLSVGANVAMWYYILQVKDALREPDKQKYTNGRENDLYRDSMLSASIFSAPVLLADRVKAAATGKTLFGHEATISAVTTDIANLRDGKIHISVPFMNIPINVGEAASNIINNNDYLNKLGESLND